MNISFDIQKPVNSFKSEPVEKAGLQQNINILQIKADQPSFINKCNLCANKKCRNAKTIEAATEVVLNDDLGNLFNADNTLEIQPNFAVNLISTREVSLSA